MLEVLLYEDFLHQALQYRGTPIAAVFAAILVLLCDRFFSQVHIAIRMSHVKILLMLSFVLIVTNLPSLCFSHQRQSPLARSMVQFPIVTDRSRLQSEEGGRKLLRPARRSFRGLNIISFPCVGLLIMLF